MMKMLSFAMTKTMIIEITDNSDNSNNNNNNSNSDVLQMEQNRVRKN